MTRKEAIDTISGLFPADAEYESTAAKGNAFLAQARKEAGQDWRDESDEVLFAYARLCEQEEARQERKTRARFASSY